MIEIKRDQRRGIEGDVMVLYLRACRLEERMAASIRATRAKAMSRAPVWARPERSRARVVSFVGRG